jgi:hypothetical protein
MLGVDIVDHANLAPVPLLKPSHSEFGMVSSETLLIGGAWRLLGMMVMMNAAFENAVSQTESCMGCVSHSVVI